MATLVLPDQELEIQAAGLDVDGVLRDTGPHIFEATCRMIEALGGKRPTYDQFLRAQDLKAEFEMVVACGVIASEEVVNAEYEKHVPSHDDEPPFDDVADFLFSLVAKRVKAFVVSRHPTEKLLGWFKQHDFHRHIEHLEGGSRDKAAHIRQICHKLGVVPEATFYVGDQGNDIRCATIAGVVPIGITRTYETRTILLETGASHVVTHLRDLAGMIL